MKKGVDSANKNALKKLRFWSRLSFEAKERLNEIKEIDKETDYTQLACAH